MGTLSILLGFFGLLFVLICVTLTCANDDKSGEHVRAFCNRDKNKADYSQIRLFIVL